VGADEDRLHRGRAFARDQVGDLWMGIEGLLVQANDGVGNRLPALDVLSDVDQFEDDIVAEEGAMSYRATSAAR